MDHGEREGEPVEPRQVFDVTDAAGRHQPDSFRFCPRCGSTLEPPDAAGRPRCPTCGYVHYRNPLPGVVVLVERAGSILLCRRSPQSFRPGAWCLPGGFIEYDEDFLSAGIREAEEETGLRVKVESILSVVSNFLSPEIHTLVAVLLGRPVGGEERPGDDAVALAWLPKDGKLPEMAFEADSHIIQRYWHGGLSGAPVDPRFAG